MKVSVDRNLCTDQAVCTGLAPAFFQLDGDGRLMLLAEDVSPEDAEDVLMAAAACPMAAIVVAE